MKVITTALSTALLGTLLLATGASAHHPTDIDVAPDCQDGQVVITVAYASFGGGHYLRVTTEVNGTQHVDDITPLTSDGAFDLVYPLDGHAGLVTSEAQAKYPNGDDEGEAIGAKAHYDCPKPPPPARYAPKAWLNGPCGDPMYRAVLDNRRSNRAVTFTWTRRSHGTWRSTTRTVQPGRLVRTVYRHVDGLTRTRVKARGQVLVSVVSAPGGNYRPCR